MPDRDKAFLRSLFPVTKNLVYLNHAAVGPLSTRAAEAMEAHARDQRDYGALHWRDWYATHDAARAAAARLIGAEESEIAILKNTSEGLAFVAEGLRWREGENVVTTALEFPSNMTPWRNLARRGVEVRVAPSPDVAGVAPLVDSRTRVVTVSSVAFHNGALADLEALGAFCRARNVRFCVDAIQSLGALPMDVRRYQIDFLAADGHKWLCGPEGAAIFFVAADRREELDIIEFGWTNIVRHGSFLDADATPRADGRRFEAGSLNTNGIYGLNAALALIEEVGIDTIEKEVIRLSALLADRLDGAGFRVGSPRPIRSGIVGCVIEEGRELMRIHGELEKEGIVCAPREGMLRFSPHHYNDDDEMERVVAALRKIMRSAPAG